MQRTVRSIDTGDGEFLREWPYVIDARGAYAGDANAVALRAYWTVPAGALSDAEASTVQIITDQVFARGYGWIFPADAADERVRFNIGVGMLSADARPGHRVREFFDRFVEVNPSLRRWHNAAQRERPVGCHVGLGLPRNAVGNARVLRIGDAANLADPLTGDGIAHALKSGRLAADAIDGARGADDAQRRWQASYEAGIQGEINRASLLQRWLTPTAAKNIAAVALTAAPPLRRRIHRAVFNETPYRGLLRT